MRADGAEAKLATDLAEAPNVIRQGGVYVPMSGMGHDLRPAFRAARIGPGAQVADSVLTPDDGQADGPPAAIYFEPVVAANLALSMPISLMSCPR